MNCRSCGGEIRWELTENGSRMPLDPDPVDGGNVQLVHHNGATTAHVVVAKPGVRLFQSHFATCPSGAGWRKR